MNREKAKTVLSDMISQAVADDNRGDVVIRVPRSITMRHYNLELRDDQCSRDVEIRARSDDAARGEAKSRVRNEAKNWCADGEWGDDGASVPINWTLTDESGSEIAYGYLTVEIEPSHDALIREAVRHEEPEGFCGYDPDVHDWTSEGEGGCDSNPGVWSTGGTSMLFASHCRACGLKRVEKHTGSQRNPGERDTVKYGLSEQETQDA